MNNDDLKRALSFYQRLKPAGSSYTYVVRLDLPGQRPPNHQAANLDSGLEPFAKALLKQAQKNPTNGIFFTPFGFTHDYHPDGGNLRKHDGYKATCRCLWVDIDVGDGKHYPDVKTALSELLRRSAALPPQILIDSGGGVHAYWVLDQSLTLDRWQVLANRLKQWLQDAGIKGDLGITPDSGRILRLPGTYNMKTGTPRECRMLKDFGGVVSVVDLEAQLPEVSNLETPQLSGLFGAGESITPESERRPSYTEEIVKKCLVLNAIGVSRGANDDEPLWKDALGAIAHTEDADVYAHVLSDGHKDYSAGAVDRKLQERADNKPITCAQLGASYVACHGTDLCAKCPHNGVIKAPISLGYKEPEPEALEKGPPWPLETRADGTYLHSRDRDGNKVIQKVTATRLISARAVVGPDLHGDYINKLICGMERNGRVEERALDIAELGQHATRRYSHLAKNNLTLDDDVIKPVSNGLRSWHRQLQEAGQEVAPVLHLGWFGHKSGEYTGFATGDQFVMRDTADPTPYLEVSELLANSYVAKGSPDVWRTAVQLLIEGQVPELLVPVYAAFASAISPFNTDSAAVVNLFTDQSGVGKTTAMQVAAAVWGDPTVAVNSMNDTVNALANKAATLNNLPLLWDEVRGNEDLDRHMMEFLFRVPQGRSKERMTGDGGKTNTFAKFRLMAVLASNSPINTTALEKGSDAAMARIFSVEMPAGIRYEDPTKRHIFSDLLHNFGHAGPEFVRYVAQHQKQVRALCRQLDDKLRAKHKPKAADRMLVTTMAQLTAAAHILHRIGLVPNDVGGFLSKLETHYESMLQLHERLKSESSSVIPIEQYLNADRVNGIVMSEIAKPKRGKPKNCDDKVLQPPLMGSSIHFELCNKTGELFIDRGHFTSWAAQAYSMFKPFEWERRAMEEGILLDRSVRRQLAAGTRHGTKTQQYCYHIQLPDVGTGGRIYAVDSDDADAEEQTG